MIEVIENAGQDIPAEIVACGPGAPAYLVIDPSEGTAQGRVAVEEQVRNSYRKGSCIIFVGVHKLPDGRIVSVGQSFDPRLAQDDLTPREREIVFGKEKT